MGAEAVAAARDGRYVAPSGAVVEIADLVSDAIAGTRSVPPNERLDTCPGGQFGETAFEVREESTLAAARRLALAGTEPVALNFASARNPGGGFLGGSRAQEESLCRASTLHACLVGQPYYAHHGRARDAMYSSWILYSPGVPVIRDDTGPLLEEPWTCGFITAAAPNVKALGPERHGEVPGVMAERVARVLAVAARERHEGVVLGAWGCGAFGGDAELVASLFHAALTGPFRGVFARVVFAVLDTREDRRVIGPFERRFR